MYLTWKRKRCYSVLGEEGMGKMVSEDRFSAPNVKQNKEYTSANPWRDLNECGCPQSFRKGMLEPTGAGSVQSVSVSYAQLVDYHVD